MALNNAGCRCESQLLLLLLPRLLLLLPRLLLLWLRPRPRRYNSLFCHVLLLLLPWLI